MRSYGVEVRRELLGLTRDLRRVIPGYKDLDDAVFASGAVDTKTKELVALAIAVSKECDGCIAAHARAAVQQGATPEEAAEIIGVTFLMNGGPVTIYGPPGPTPPSWSSTPAAPWARPARKRPWPPARMMGIITSTRKCRVSQAVGWSAGWPPPRAVRVA
jgi:AhpD family alkylhydroperoxidase